MSDSFGWHGPAQASNMNDDFNQSGDRNGPVTVFGPPRAILHTVSSTYSNQVGDPVIHLDTDGHVVIRRLLRYATIEVETLIYSTVMISHPHQCVLHGDYVYCFCRTDPMPTVFVKNQIEIREQYRILQAPNDPLLQEAIPTQDNA